MATISFEEIKRVLSERRNVDDASIVEIRFDDCSRTSTALDPEMVNRVITAECSYGSVIIMFNGRGQLSTVEIA